MVPVVMACALVATACNQQTPTASAPIIAGAVIANGTTSTVTPTLTPTHTPTLTPTPTPTFTPTFTPTPTPTFTPTPSTHSPYMVKQTQTLGGEKISGSICGVTGTFDVFFATPKINFVTHFYPDSDIRGKWAYAYTITSAGESHEAAGSYSLQRTSKTGELTLSMTGRDHVVFHGFDGNIPSHYTFDLVPALGVPCP
jgi:hypothetical protein